MAPSVGDSGLCDWQRFGKEIQGRSNPLADLTIVIPVWLSVFKIIIIIIINTTPRLAEGIMAGLWTGFWTRETGTGQQVAQLHER
jgi:hypothetical protein